jgi:hypothetical protein
MRKVRGGSTWVFLHWPPFGRPLVVLVLSWSHNQPLYSSSGFFGLLASLMFRLLLANNLVVGLTIDCRSILFSS